MTFRKCCGDWTNVHNRLHRSQHRIHMVYKCFHQSLIDQAEWSSSSFWSLSQLLTKVGLYFHQSFGLHKIIVSRVKTNPWSKDIGVIQFGFVFVTENWSEEILDVSLAQVLVTENKQSYLSHCCVLSMFSWQGQLSNQDLQTNPKQTLKLWCSHGGHTPCSHDHDLIIQWWFLYPSCLLHLVDGEKVLLLKFHSHGFQRKTQFPLF